MSSSLRVRVSIQSCPESNNGTSNPTSFVIYADEGTCTDTVFGSVLQPLTECDTESGPSSPQWIDPGSEKEFSAGNLTVGKVYYFEIGSGTGVNCVYLIEVLEGSTEVPQLTGFMLDNIYDPCLGEIVDYAIINPEPATDYIYTLNGDTISGSAFATVAYDQPGEYEICIGGNNSCSKAPTTCYRITVRPPQSTYIDASLCPGECYITSDTTLCRPGNYSLSLFDRFGCDSLVHIQLTNRTPDTTVLEVTICEGDTLRFLEHSISEAGTYAFPLANSIGCDSTVVVQLALEGCLLQGALVATDVSCYPEMDGSIRFHLTSGSPPYRYNFHRLGGGPSGKGRIFSRGAVVLAELPAGTYSIEVRDTLGRAVYFTTEIERPSPIGLLPVLRDYHGRDISCHDSQDGRISLTVSGGSPPFTFAWSGTNDSGPTASNLSAGAYTVTVTDGNGCTATTAAVLTPPPPLRLSVTTVNEACERSGTGQVFPPEISGGTGASTFTLFHDSTVVSAQHYSALATGTYRLVAKDANGCPVDTLLEITAPVRPSVSIFPDNARVMLGEQIILSVPDQVGSQYRWSPVDFGNCATCARITVQPLASTTYRITAIAPGGCLASDSTRVTVIPVYNVYVPTAFSPNRDGYNDEVILYSGKSLRIVRQMSIYDRWGGLQFVARDFPAATAADHGWNGELEGRPAPPGMYLWVAEVEFLDGTVKTLSGTLALIR
ncbi:gliding motility-associated C-terminal domain-containing protein [Lewinella sp. IMCC34191]|uniref:T9SS type B sorting domain-containing protein n=1 Tax=Lewinella sp. IMCC34191 TaxID=2259172 RepID=UPI0018E5836F|nr:gliding motility-associated C-terminal domain-containing protein [Lewinella sp. IMCC34191]